ncbi:TonB-dependent receptor plug domain-containing protein [Maribellus comscasis]|uniref:TonB-dependent receptor plug domain-containing protein n=1 Tax=Maribellus comscasis TaxID=2681766 RepID=A0A6I6K1D5_9BACT|nr:TonB-dependent receptor [Maribellus comscasis]QGY47260.1 TonB-dependent receptor plug domain-containing protein [Maribellus comscasis]
MLKTINYTNLFLSTLLLYFFVHPVTAQNEKEQVKQDSTELSEKIGEVTVTAFRTPYNLLNTPAPVHLISSLQLETGNAFTPVEALNQVPGILMHHGTLNTNRLTIRGIGSRTPYATNKIKAYLGEIPLTSGDGETTLEDLENSSIKRVEIIKGPSSSLFGAGLGGVILFHPKTVARDFAEIQTTLASFNTIKSTLSTGVIQNKTSIFALGSYLKSNGFRENNNTKRTNLLLHSQYSFSTNVNLQVLLKATKMKAFIPSSLDLPTFENHPEQAASNWKNVKGYEDYVSGQFGISLNVYTRRDEKISFATFGSYRDADELRPFNTLDEQSHYLGWRGYIQKNISGEHSSITFTSGLEFFRENYNWSTLSNENSNVFLSDNQEKRSYENLFFQMESGFWERLYISAGINGNLTRFDYADHFIENGDQSGKHSYKPVLSPRLGFNILLMPRLSFFGNVSNGFSTPSFEETLLPEGEINPDIKPENGWNYEAGFRTLFSDQLQASLSYYRIYVNNLLVARRTGEDAYIGVNAGESLHPGLEAEAKWSVLPAGNYPNLNLGGNATFANYHFTNFIDNNVDYSGKMLPGTAKNIWMINSVFSPTRNFKLHIWYRHTGEMAVNDANSDFTNPYGITNAEIKYAGRLKSILVELKGGVQNIFDLNYPAMLAVNAPAFGGNLARYYYPGDPRNFYFSVFLRLE